MFPSVEDRFNLIIQTSTTGNNQKDGKDYFYFNQWFQLISGVAGIGIIFALLIFVYRRFREKKSVEVPLTITFSETGGFRPRNVSVN